MPIISLCGAKGGSLKTATSLSLASLLVERGQDVALVDLDAQHSATLALPRNVGDSVADTADGEEVGHEGVSDPLSAPAIEIGLPEWPDARGRLALHRGGRGLVAAHRREIRRRIDGIRADAVVIDTMPAVGDIVVAAMECSDLVVIPTEATADALRVLPGVVETARTVAPPGCRIRLLLSRVDARECITTDAREVLERDYPGLLYRTAIPADVRAKEAAWYLRPVTIYAPECRAALAYRALLEEIAADLDLDLDGREEVRDDLA